MRTKASLVAACSVLALCLAGCGGPAQIGADRDTFKAVDALYTAVSLRDPALLDRCAADLRKLQGSGKLPEDALGALDGMIAEARTGQWEASQERLARFMEGQRR
jgi:hypothetical protein